MSSFAVSDDIGSFLGESSALIRPTGGLEGSLIFNEKITLNVGIHFVRRGASYNDIDVPFDFIDDGGDPFGNPDPGFGGGFGGLSFQPDIDASFIVRLSYLHFPVSAGYRFELSDNIFIEPHAGFYYAYALAGFGEIDGSVSVPFLGSIPFNEKETFDFENDFKRHDFGVMGGVSFEVYNFFIRYNYNYGLMNISQPGDENFDDDGFIGFDNDPEISSRFSALHLGYRIKF